MISSFGQGVQGEACVPLGVICFLTCFINLDSMKKDKFLFVFVREGRLVKKVE